LEHPPAANRTRRSQFTQCGETWGEYETVEWVRQPGNQHHVACANLNDDLTLGICRSDGIGHEDYSHCNTLPPNLCSDYGDKLWFVFCTDLTRVPTLAPTPLPTPLDGDEPPDGLIITPAPTPVALTPAPTPAGFTPAPTVLQFLLANGADAGATLMWVELWVVASISEGDCFTLEGGGTSEAVCIAGFGVSGVLTASILLVDPTTVAYPVASVFTLQEGVVLTTTSAAYVRDDPHVCALSGECFDIREPSEYTLLRAPFDEREPAALQLSGDLDTDGVQPCGLFVKHLALSGSLLDGRVVRVRPHTREAGGANRAAKQVVTNFSLQVGNSSWLSFTPNDSLRRVAVVGQLTVRFVWREQYGQHIEAESLEFSVGGGGHPVVLTISQAAHQALNLDMGGLGRLGHSRLGGVLGTEGHLTSMEEPTPACRSKSSNHDDIQQRQLAGMLAPAERASILKASWA